MKTIWRGLEIDTRKGETLVRAFERTMREMQEASMKKDVPLVPVGSSRKMRVKGQDYEPTT
ncbi:hypothetical protein N9100_01695 [Gammaproteobacteria bacterium]|nr:hypothetical protein [Gammaproteobacteria bacterium]